MTKASRRGAPDTETYDYIVVGGGVAGCILANRLSEDPGNTVLLLEAGGTGKGFWIDIPAGFSKLLTDDRFNWRFWTEPEANVNNRTIAIPRGKGLGGSSLINGMIFVRGQAYDFDHWAELGNDGWSYADVLPYFRKLEQFEDGENSYRGGDGPMKIARVAERSPLSEAFIESAVEAGYRRNTDYNGEDQEGFGYYQANQWKGRRWSAAKAYLDPAASRSNLVVRTDATAIALTFEGKKCTGVDYRHGGDERRATVRGEVILAAGAVQTPPLLEASGVGDPELLKRLGVPVRHALRGVGENYREHFCTRMNWRVNRPITLNEQTRGLSLAMAVLRYFTTRTGILSLGTGLAHGFVRTRPGLPGPDVQFFFMHASYANAADRKLDSEPGLTIGVAQLRPQSRGSIHMRSTDPLSAPVIRPNFLAEEEDKRSLIDGMVIAREIMGRPAMRDYLAYEMSPGDAVRSDADWLDFARSNGQTGYHPVGTCAMGTGPDAVVDCRLRVRGIDGVRVVDASVMPTMISGNTAAAVMMIAEKGASMILHDARDAG